MDMWKQRSLCVTASLREISRKVRRGAKVTPALIILLLLLFVACGGDDGAARRVPPAQVSGVSPAIVFPGQIDARGSVFGSNLEGMVSVSLGDGISIHSAEVFSSSEIRLIFSVSQSAPPGVRNLTLFTVEGTQ